MAKYFITPKRATWQERLDRFERWYNDKHPRSAYLRNRMLGEVWYGEQDRAEVRTIYQQAKRRQMQVDHIVPLCAGGLHVACNLQLLPKHANAYKCGKLPDSVTGQQKLLPPGVVPHQLMLL